jgi:hypothetical protein
MLLLLVGSFKACRKHFCRASGNSSLQLELAVLSLLQAIATHPVSAARCATLSRHSTQCSMRFCLHGDNCWQASCFVASISISILMLI